MTNQQKWIAFFTMLRREVLRMFRIASQVFLPPVITTTLYFLIFGEVIGMRIGNIADLPYPLFIAPGLILMAILTNSYGNVSSSLYNMRFQKSIEEILVSPMSNAMIISGFVVGGMLRGVLVGLLVFGVSCFFVDYQLHHLLLAFLILLLVAALFSLAGFCNALLANSFDDIMIIPTFVLTPLTYLGGVFFSTNMLSPFWRGISYLNPIQYMVDAFRYALIGYSANGILVDLLVIMAFLLAFILINSMMMQKNMGLRE